MRLIGLWALVLLAGCNGAASRNEDTEQSGSQIGRYQITAVPGTTQAILLDTLTGQTWYRVSTGSSEREDVTQWLPMDKTGPREWMELNAPLADIPEGAHPYRR